MRHLAAREDAITWQPLVCKVATSGDTDQPNKPSAETPSATGAT